MNSHLDQESHPVAEVLVAANAPWDLAEAHGACAGWACLGGASAIQGWAGEILGRIDQNDALAVARQRELYEFAATVLLALEKGNLEFDLLLAHDSAQLADRAATLAEWCQGFMHGFAAAAGVDAARARQAMQQGVIKEIIADFSEITRAAVGDEAEEASEQAYAELVEYVRVSAQLVYDETAGFRKPAGNA